LGSCRVDAPGGVKKSHPIERLQFHYGGGPGKGKSRGLQTCLMKQRHLSCHTPWRGFRDLPAAKKKNKGYREGVGKECCVFVLCVFCVCGEVVLWFFVFGWCLWGVFER